MAVRLGYDEALLAKVAERLARAAMQDMRWSVKKRHGLGSVERLFAGVFTVVQRFRSDLGLHVHLHYLVTDGAFEERGDGVRFLPAATPTPERLVAVLAQVHKGLGVAAEDDLDMDRRGVRLAPQPGSIASAAPPSSEDHCRPRHWTRRKNSGMKTLKRDLSTPATSETLKMPSTDRMRFWWL